MYLRVVLTPRLVPLGSPGSNQWQDLEQVIRKDKSMNDPFSLLFGGTLNAHVRVKLTSRQCVF